MRAPPIHVAIGVIQKEHDQLAAVIHGMRHTLRAISQGATAPDMKLFRAMLLYIIDYPEKVHHPKEDQALFARLRARTHEVDEALDRLEGEHAQGEAQVNALEHALTLYEFDGEPAFPRFFELVENYATFYFNHMRTEEEVILPAAIEHLTPQDWAMIDAQFATNQEHAATLEAKRNLDKLFSLIANMAPEPIGLGPAL